MGAFALAGAVAGPPLGALVDRIGQTRVLVPAAAAQAALLVLLVIFAQAGAPVEAVVALAALAGAVQPPIAGCIRALWPAVVLDGDALESVYALDATSQEAIWILGPLLIGLTVGLLSAAAAVLLCALITLGGTALFAASRLSSGWRAPGGRRSRAGALASPGLRVLLASALAAGVVIGAVEVGLPALAVQHGSRWSAGLLLAVFSLGSMTGGLLYSARSWRMAAGLRYAILLIALALAVAPLIVLHSLAAAFLLSALAGLGVRADARLSVLARRSARAAWRHDGGVHLAESGDDRRHGSRVGAGRIADRRPRRGRRVRAGVRERGARVRAGDARARPDRSA